ncbi:PIG-L family deacetylase [Pelagicoccus sp. SDUM812005]|uniref:PIG-L deacetylase family protein n=1 Tax=Pelagicoccus sp. SDUM812005 TaxID=3041257 RepID=UPI00280E714D|nr:PIG-L family deacetylase [Pelagicoccus sp. SDUM812005]MDQ8181512.1 PIG-L family deacetylase [Pelagicoccus sp. SDUM812005]
MEKHYIPDGVSLQAAQARVTHMGIGAHQDDLEIFAYHGIAACYRSASNWFAGVTVTDGGGSAREGLYRDYTDEQMKEVRHREQNRAAKMGGYSFQSQLGVPSKVVKDAEASSALVDELYALLDACRPHTLYLHNPADKHDTHIAVLARSLEALRRLPAERRPERVYGCEVWRDLDWLDDAYKIALPVDEHPILARDLVAVFESQVAGGKDYVNATLGRRHANATFYQSHSVDEASGYTFAMDLGPLLLDESLSVQDFVRGHLDRFRTDVLERIQKMVR